MPSGTRKLEIVIAGDAKGAINAFDKVSSRSEGMGRKLAGVGKAAALGLGAAAVGAAALGKSFVDAAIESQKIAKQTDAVFKSMGKGAGGTTAAGVEKLATQLSMMSGVDDEVIQSAQNVLLTFGKVRNEVGKGNDIFDRASKSALDMSVALGTDMQGASIQVGKALNDPIKGITALSRAGVSFTEDQKKTIKSLVATGDTLGAQKIILKELENQFGGSAKAQATAGARLKVVWGNLQEQLGAKLLPVIEKVASFLADNLPGAMDAAGKVFKRISVLWEQFTAGFKFGSEDFVTGSGGIGEAAIKLGDAMRKVVDWVEKNWPKIQEVTATVFAKVQSVIVPVMTTVGQVISGVVDVVMTLWNNFGNNILEVIQRIWPRVQQIIEAALNIIQGIVKTVTSLIHGDWSGVWEGMKQVVAGVWEAIQGIIGGALELIRGAIGIGLEIIGSVFKGAWDAISSTASGAWEGILGFFQSIPETLGSIFGGLADVITAPFRAAFNAIADVWNNTVGSLSFSVPGWVPGLGGKGFNVPDIPTWGGGKTSTVTAASLAKKHRLAAGGIVKHTPGGIFANIGEGRHDEAVIPLDGKHSLGGEVHIHLHDSVLMGTDEMSLKRSLVALLNQAHQQGIRLAGA